MKIVCTFAIVSGISAIIRLLNPRNQDSSFIPKVRKSFWWYINLISCVVMGLSFQIQWKSLRRVDLGALLIELILFSPSSSSSYSLNRVEISFSRLTRSGFPSLRRSSSTDCNNNSSSVAAFSSSRHRSLSSSAVSEVWWFKMSRDLIYEKRRYSLVLMSEEI